MCVCVCEGVCVCQVRVAGRWMRSEWRRSRCGKCRVAARVKWKDWAMDMSGLRGDERCCGREVATGGVKVEWHAVKI